MTTDKPMPTVPPIPRQYSAETVYRNGERMMLYVDGSIQRLDEYSKTRQPSIKIRRPDKGVEWSLSPHTNTYSEVKLPPEMDAALEQELDRFLSEEWNEDGTEMIDAHLCRRYVGRYREPGFKLAGEARTVCYIDTQTGLRRREYNYDAKGDLVATIDYSAGPPPRTVFELPAGCKRG